MFEILGIRMKPRGMWLTYEAPDGDSAIVCSVCGNKLDPVASTVENYTNEDGDEVEERVDVFIPTKYCPICHSRMVNYGCFEFGD